MSTCRKASTSTSAGSRSSGTTGTGAATPTARTPRPCTFACAASPGPSTSGGCRTTCRAAATATSSASSRTAGASSRRESAGAGADLGPSPRGGHERSLLAGPPRTEGAGPGLVAGEVRRRPRWPLLVDEGVAQLGVWLARIVEVPVHLGQLRLAVDVERLNRGGRGQLLRLGGQPRWIVRAAGQLLGCGGHLSAVGGSPAADHLVDQAAPQRRRGTDR